MTAPYEKRLIELVEELEERARHLRKSSNLADNDVYASIVHLQGYIEVLKENQPE